MPNMTRPPIPELDSRQNTKPPTEIPPENCLGPGPKATQLTITANEANATIAAVCDTHLYRPNRVARGTNPTAANATPVSATTQRGTWSACGGNGIHAIPTAMIAEPAAQKAMADSHAVRPDEPDDPLEVALTMSKIPLEPRPRVDRRTNDRAGRPRFSLPVRFLLVEGAGTLDRIVVDGDRFRAEPLRAGFRTPTSVTRIGSVAWVSEGQMPLLFDPARKGDSLVLPFRIYAVPLNKRQSQ
jgi:hypothetical protein